MSEFGRAIGRPGWRAIALLLTLCGTAAAQSSAPATGPRGGARPTAPETVGFSTARLERLHVLVQDAADHRQVAGAVTLLARHGRIVDYRAYGARDLASGTPMTKDTIFRAFSMTKPVTAVAMMLLYEQGKWLPTDPIAKYVPELAKLKVFKATDAAGQMVLEDPVHAPTMAELMSHTAGFVYGFFGNTPVDEAYRKAGVMQSASLQEMVDKLARIPLAYQPGSKWVYSVSMDVEGYIVEKLSGQSLPEFMEQNIFRPLRMQDTGFFVPAGKRGRFATLYRADEKGELVTEPPERTLRGDYSSVPRMPSGGGGLVTTAEDYFRFAQMLGNGGELDGVRVLSPASVRLMSANHLLPHLLTGEFGIGQQVMRPGLGYGYNCAVAYDPPLANLPEGRGTFFWDGAAGTWFWVDPTNDVVFVGMIQRMGGPGMPSLQYLSRAVVYQALVDPKR
jgi:CubicO group peptidase (beta-lactamase class C family)